MKMEPHVAVITRHPVSRVTALLREVGYLVTKVTPETVGDYGEAEALVVDLGLFDLIHWLAQRNVDDDKVVIIAPTASFMAGVRARTLRARDVEDDLASTVDRIVANQRIAAHRKQQVARAA